MARKQRRTLMRKKEVLPVQQIAYPPRNLADLSNAFMETIAPSTIPSFESTIRQVALFKSGQPDPSKVPIEDCYGLLQDWDHHINECVKKGTISAASARQYRSRVHRLIEWSIANNNYPARGRGGQLDLLGKLNTHAYALLKALCAKKLHSLRRELQRFLLFIEQNEYALEDLEERGEEITREYFDHLTQRNVTPSTCKGYYWDTCRALHRLHLMGLLPAYQTHCISSQPSYKIPREEFPPDLRYATDRFKRLASDTSRKAADEWRWRPVKPITVDQISDVVGRYVGWQAQAQKLDITNDSNEVVFSRERLKGYWQFYRERNPNGGRGCNSIFEQLQVFAERACELDVKPLFRQLINPHTQSRLRPENLRTIPQWFQIIAAVQEAIRKTKAEAEKLSLERFLMVLHLIIASLLRINSLLLARVEHLQRTETHFVLRIPPEDLKSTRTPKDNWHQVPLPKRLTKPIEHYLHNIHPVITSIYKSTFLFPVASEKDQPVKCQFLTQQLKKFDERVHNIPREQTTSFHTLRKVASMELTRKKDHGTYLASKALGHTSTNTTRNSYNDVHSRSLIRRDWQLQELINKSPLSDQNIADILEILERYQGEWEYIVDLIEQGGTRID